MRIYKINNLLISTQKAKTGEAEVFARYNNDWIAISRHQYLDDKFIEKYKEQLFLSIIIKYQKLSEETMENIILKERFIDFEEIFKYQKITEQLVENCENKICGKRLSAVNFLTWNNIAQYQSLSVCFFKKYKKFINKNCILKNKHLSNYDIKEILMFLK